MTTASKSAIDKIHEFHRFGSVLGLSRMKELMRRLGNPERELPCIHVAGTNGKGSVCRFLYEVLRQQGYRVGIYTSPYLTVFNERIELDGSYIQREELEAFTEETLEKVEEMVRDGFDSPTEFEVITAVAFLFFARRRCDFAIMEVGLGGRGDSTNVIEHPLAAVITSISYDHTDRLGNTLSEIAAEKAGILKKGAPAIMNVDTEEAAKVIARAAYRTGAVLYDVSKISCENVREDLNGSRFDVVIGDTVYKDLGISMLGRHQVANAVTALAALDVLRREHKITIEKEKLYRGFLKAKNIGRFEIIRAGKPFIILDGAHNEAGAAALAETIKTLFAGKKILTVAGVLSDKAVSGILDHLCSFCGEFIAAEPRNERKLAAEVLAEKIRERGRVCTVCADPKEAMRAALERSREDFDVLLFAGSLYLVGEIRGELINGEQ
mgnify:CR=1 FL=1